MLRFHHFLFVALLVATVLATPIKLKQKRSFKVKRVEQTNYVANGRAAYRRALFKFGFDDIEFVPTGEVASRLRATVEAQLSGDDGEDGETTAEPTQNDAQFLSPVTIGGQTIVMNFDSGSSDT